jgi:hypothetical protein
MPPSRNLIIDRQSLIANSQSSTAGSCASCQFTTKTTCVLWPASGEVPAAVPVIVTVKIPTAVLGADVPEELLAATVNVYAPGASAGKP